MKTYKLHFIDSKGLHFNWSPQEGSIIMSGEPLCEIIVDPRGVCDGPEHLAWCLTLLREEGKLPEGTENLKRLGSMVEPLDIEMLAYQGECPGRQTISAVLKNGIEVYATKDVAYY